MVGRPIIRAVNKIGDIEVKVRWNQLVKFGYLPKFDKKSWGRVLQYKFYE